MATKIGIVGKSLRFAKLKEKKKKEEEDKTQTQKEMWGSFFGAPQQVSLFAKHMAKCARPEHSVPQALAFYVLSFTHVMIQSSLGAEVCWGHVLD